VNFEDNFMNMTAAVRPNLLFYASLKFHFSCQLSLKPLGKFLKANVRVSSCSRGADHSAASVIDTK
jgi:hypothetical protein